MPRIEEVFGLESSQIVDHEGVSLHRDALDCWLALKESAADAGFEIRAASAYRSYADQLRIWNDKASGLRVLLDRNECEIAYESLQPEELVWAILNWSALPGASRHHWGTEFDVFEVQAMPVGYELKLTVEETKDDGVFAAFYEWLDMHLETTQFCRPYAGQNHVAPEPWHLSCKPVSQQYEEALTLDALEAFVTSRNDLLLKHEVLENLEAIYSRYILV